jgi:hypothetical protein
MAITRTQIAKQLLAQGGRTGFFEAGLAAGDNISPGTSVSGGTRGNTGKGRDTDFQQRGVSEREYNRRVAEGTTGTYSGPGPTRTGPQIRRPFIPTPVPRGQSFLTRTRNKLIRSRLNRDKRLALQRLGLIPKTGFKGFLGSTLDAFTGKVPEQFELMSEEDLLDIATSGPYLSQQKTKADVSRFDSGKDLLGRVFKAEDLLRKGDMTQTKFEELFPGPKPSDDDKDGPEDPCLGPNPPAYCFVGIRSAAPAVEEPEYVNPLSLLTPRIAGSQFAADGGRIGAQEGGIMPRLNQLGSGVSSAEQMLQGINQRLESAESSLGEGGGTEVVQASGTLNGKPLFPEGTTFPSGGMKLPVFTGTPQQINPAPFMRPGNIPGTNVPFSTLRGGSQFSQVTPPQTPVAMQTPLSGIPAAGYADGGRITSLEDMDREGFLLGGIAKGLKKAVRGIKKLAKSPIGKAALTFAAFNYGPQLLSGKGFGLGKATKFSQLKLFGGDIPINPVRFAGIPAILAGLTPEEKDKFDADSYYASNKLNPSQSIRMVGSDFDFYGGQRIASAEGGSTDKEPVAKKTMPLLDMGGKEMDLREEGGFVPIGRMEKADDVPARLSKNEFVFTADAVRNAGEGDVDKGAEVMYNMMKNLEAGGEVSEESQGLEGARKMFQTSQRLEEVL